MASVRWSPAALEELDRLDRWRTSHEWEPIADEIVDSVDAYFTRYKPRERMSYLPGRPASLEGRPTGVRVVGIVVRSKQFRVYYRPAGRTAVEIMLVLHPRSQG